jgi:hypothetical protein
MFDLSKGVILSEGFRDPIAKGVVEGPAVCLVLRPVKRN